MCGRFSQSYTWEEIHALSQPLVNRLPAEEGNLRPRYNIAPTTQVHMIAWGEGGPELRSARWGLVPFWWKKPLRGMPSTFNARVETVDQSGMFRGAFKQRRCIIPATGFFEWTGKEVLHAPPPALREWIVSQQVNKAGSGNDDPATIAPIAA